GHASVAFQRHRPGARRDRAEGHVASGDLETAAPQVHRDIGPLGVEPERAATAFHAHAAAAGDACRSGRLDMAAANVLALDMQIPGVHDRRLPGTAGADGLGVVSVGVDVAVVADPCVTVRPDLDADGAAVTCRVGPDAPPGGDRRRATGIDPDAGGIAVVAPGSDRAAGRHFQSVAGECVDPDRGAAG